MVSETKFTTGLGCTNRKVNFDEVPAAIKDFKKNECVILVKTNSMNTTKLQLADCAAVKQFICWTPPSKECTTTEGTTTKAPNI